MLSLVAQIEQLTKEIVTSDKVQTLAVQIVKRASKLRTMVSKCNVRERP